MRTILIISSLILLISGSVLANSPKVGRQAAQEYFQEDAKAYGRRPAAVQNAMMIYLGTFMGTQAYQWGCSCKMEDVGKSQLGITYIYDEWNSMDLSIRVDYSEFKVGDVAPRKLSFLPLLTFPRIDSGFPLYFGIGAGAGVFMQQVDNESSISLDYQLVAGARFPEIWEAGGLFVEFAMKNHLHLLSDGQLNGTALSAGGIFLF